MTTSTTVSPLPTPSSIADSKLKVQPSSLTPSADNTPRIPSTSTTPTPAPMLSGPNSDELGRKGELEEDELQEDEAEEDDDELRLPPLPTKPKEMPSRHPPLMTTAVMKAPPISAIPPPTSSFTSKTTTVKAPINTPSPRNGGIQHAGAGGGRGSGSGNGKSRKSSCEICHFRKIKCDQQRPSCSSCTRKGHKCKYADEAGIIYPSLPAITPRPNFNQRAMSVTVVNASDPSIKYTMPVPGSTKVLVSSNNTNTPTPSLKVGYGQGQNASPHPGWKVTDGTNTHHSGTSGGLNGSGYSEEKKKKAERRERIVSGFDSDSEEENDSKRDEREGSVKGKGKDENNAVKDLDGELVALVEEGDQENKRDDIDELEEEDQDADNESGLEIEARNKKRSAEVDDDISGELLELASAPPKKKKPSSSTSSLYTHPQHILSKPATKPVTHKHSHGKPSIPVGVFPPTPITSTPFASRNDVHRFDPYTSPLQYLANSLPTPEMQQILFNTFFTDPFLTEGISLLQSQYMEGFKGFLERRHARYLPGDATTLANAYAILATALRILPEETGKLILASQVHITKGLTNVPANIHFPRSLAKLVACQPAALNDPTPLDQRYLDLALISAQIAEQADPPSIMLVAFKLILYRSCMLGNRKDKVVLAGMWLAQAVKVAQALGMGKEWEGLTQADRELRRRVMWSLYVADRHHSFETSFPYTMMDAHQGIHLPSPMAETDLYQLRPDVRELPAHATEIAPTACTALFIHTHLARRITPILDSFATISAANTPHDLVLRFDASLDAFQDALPPYFKLYPLTETQFDSTNPYLIAHRLRLHSTLLEYRIGAHRTHLLNYLLPSSANSSGLNTEGIRKILVGICLTSIRVQRSIKLFLDPKISFRLFNPTIIFENSMTLSLIMYIEKYCNMSSTNNINYMYSQEWLSMKNGLSESIELLENAIQGEGQTYARRSVAVIREFMSRVDIPLKPLLRTQPQSPTQAQAQAEPQPQPQHTTTVKPEISPLQTNIPLDHHESRSQSHDPHPPPGHGRRTKRHSTPTDTEQSRMKSPKSHEKHTSIPISTTMSPQKSSSSSNNPAPNNQQQLPSVLSGTPPLQQRQPPQLDPYITHIVLWLTDISNSGLNLEVLLREPEWVNGWERIAAGM
ncbi:uncharacterized protein L201_002584 [Kwoniella dendrophila CBS 6074]|uniref:Zn(2)-C6 fungal-type domain-containing protein n=1 Tax=Kwoniella dendrophila CBS 6074 TaxID=1295534 RepID=A0AAX4JQN8_9TREE